MSTDAQCLDSVTGKCTAIIDYSEVLEKQKEEQAVIDIVEKVSAKLKFITLDECNSLIYLSKTKTLEEVVNLLKESDYLTEQEIKLLIDSNNFTTMDKVEKYLETLQDKLNTSLVVTKDIVLTDITKLYVDNSNNSVQITLPQPKEFKEVTIIITPYNTYPITLVPNSATIHNVDESVLLDLNTYLYTFICVKKDNKFDWRLT